MTPREPSDDPFESIIRGNTWDDIPGDDEDLDPWAEDVVWRGAEQPVEDVPPELREDPEDEVYDPDPGPVTGGISPAMLRALSAVLAVVVVVTGLSLLPGPLPGLVWTAALAGLVGALVLVFRALPSDPPEDDDGAVV
ncbi:hypothetical protein CWC38_08115 [Kocuria tytonicola]|uniref:hypothetical protein n=1 Tax=Kocuria tytonicola TaxID=2055946 RepID=UPI000EF8BFCE|nr:hypothetical protein [Kocuria tytonicola]RLZ02993.1 hypothetical protein CWC38_08115 [Kocuria tytonicola]